MNAQPENRNFPRFQDFPVAEPYVEKTHPLRYETPEHERFRDELKIAEVRLPTFAGHYIAIEMSCGPECERLAFVDAKTGKIHGSPFKTSESQFALPPPNWDFQQPRYSAYSRLLVVPNVCPDGPDTCSTFYFVVTIWPSPVGDRRQLLEHGDR